MSASRSWLPRLPALLLWLLLWLLLAAWPADPARAAAGVVFDEPSAEGAFGETISFSTTFRSPGPPQRVELLTRLPGADGDVVDVVDVERLDGETWRATAYRSGHVVPNTRWQYRFRVVTDDGVVLGPAAGHRVVDERFEWRVLRGAGVNVWWHEGGDDFGRRALAIAEEALASASRLLGVAGTEAVDFFVYADMGDFRQALGPATRENTGGQANLAIHTLFAHISPRQIDSEWVRSVVPHEIAHLVFHEAVDSPYQYPPLWLNEGVAVYLSTGYTDGQRAQVRGAAQSGTIIPLEGLGGNFPTRVIRRSLAYAESVSAVDFFVRTYGQHRLVELIAAFGEGRSTDEAFVAATGEDFAAFDEAWLASVGAQPPAPYGPREGEPGQLPDEWAAEVAVLLG